MVWFTLLGLVAVAGGLIAYAGDVVGRKIGRKHLRLFGLRPKTTGLIFAVGSGVAVALLSVFAVWLLARDTLDTALEAQAIRAERNRVQGEVESLGEDLSARQDELVRAQAAARQLRANQAAERRRAQVELEAERAAAEADLQASRRELEATAALNARLDERARELTAERDRLSGQIVARTRELTAERDRLSRQIAEKTAELTAQRDRLTRQIAEKTAELATQRDRLTRQIASKTRELTAERDRLSGQIAAKTRELAAQRDRLSAQVAARSEELAALGLASAGRTARLSTSISQLEAQRAALGDNLRELRANLSALTDQQAGLTRRIEGLLADKETAEARARAAQAQLLKARGDLAGLGDRLSLVDRQVEILSAERRDLEGAKRRLEADVSALATVKEGLASDVGQLRRQNAALEASLSENRASLNEERVRNQALSGTLRTAEKALTSASRGEFIYRKGELVVQALLPDGDEATVRRLLEAALVKARTMGEKRGAARTRGSATEATMLGPGEFERLVGRAVASSGPGLLLVRSGRNLPRGLPMRVELEVLPNAVLYPAAGPIRTKRIDLGSSLRPASDEAVLSQLSALLDEAVAELLARGVPVENIPDEPMGAEEVAAFVERLRGPAENAALQKEKALARHTIAVAVASRDEVTPAGPFRLYLTVVP